MNLIIDDSVQSRNKIHNYLSNHSTQIALSNFNSNNCRKRIYRSSSTKNVTTFIFYLEKENRKNFSHSFVDGGFNGLIGTMKYQIYYKKTVVKNAIKQYVKEI